MDVLLHFVDLILHLDKYLDLMIREYGTTVYAILFVIIFVETGLVVMPFLPGDSLLFIAGAFAATGALSLPLLIVLLIIAAVLGNTSNYWIGRKIGPRVFQWENSRFFNRNAFDKAHAFYEKHGAITIIATRFLPFLRTFSPFVAGVAAMGHGPFQVYNTIGGVLWIASLTIAGYFFGNIPVIKDNLTLIIVALIVIPGLPALFVAFREWRAARARRAR
ncbi:MAG TPA: DedA family protein [Burkholderiales bacterium]|jgi:membrane-associated protein